MAGLGDLAVPQREPGEVTPGEGQQQGVGVGRGRRVGAPVRGPGRLRGTCDVLREQPPPDAAARPSAARASSTRSRTPCTVAAYARCPRSQAAAPRSSSLCASASAVRSASSASCQPCSVYRHRSTSSAARCIAPGGVSAGSSAAASAQQARERSRHTAVWRGSSAEVVPVPDMAEYATLPSPSAPSSFEWWPHLSTNRGTGPRGRVKDFTKSWDSPPPKVSTDGGRCQLIRSARKKSSLSSSRERSRLVNCSMRPTR